MTLTLTRSLALALPCTLVLIGCATQPMGPTVLVMPSPTKPFEVFQQDQAMCMQYAQSMVGGQAQAANERAVGSAAVGAVLGAALGAAVGNHQGAGIGAAGGAIVGTSAAGPGTSYSQGTIQYQYNNAYLQCMYARGNQVPGYRR
ncbi:glycine zipper family protein [Comamonas sp. Tr-654]|nr:glycine zipper family protein [Comamonas sp. Tr-654]